MIFQAGYNKPSETPIKKQNIEWKATENTPIIRLLLDILEELKKLNSKK